MNRVVPCVALAVLLSIAPLARAQDAAAATDAAAPADYGALIDSAVEEFAAGRWAEARALFGRAQAMYPNARALRGVGMAAYELRDYVEAYRALGDALVATRRPLSAEQRAQVEALRARTENFVGRFALEPAAAGATLTVDGRAVPLDRTLFLGIGDHELALLEPARAPRRTSVSVRGGEVDVALAFPPTEALPVAPPTPGPSVALGDPDPEPEPVASSGGSAWPYVVLGVGAAGTVAGGILLGVGLSDYSSVSGATAGSAEWADLESANARTVTLQWAGGALAGVGLAAVVTGLAWALGEPGEEARARDAWVSFGLGSVALGGRF